MAIVYTQVIFERLNEEGRKQLQSAIDEGEEAFNERFGFNATWEELGLDVFKCGTRSEPPLEALSQMITWLATADKDVVARLLWVDDEDSFFGCAVYGAYYTDGGDPEFECDADGEEHYFQFDNDCISIIKRDYEKQLIEAGVSLDDDNAISEWAALNNVISEAINTVQYDATEDDVAYSLNQSFKQYPDGDPDRRSGWWLGKRID